MITCALCVVCVYLIQSGLYCIVWELYAVLVSTGTKVEVNEQEESIYIESSTSSMCSCWLRYIYTYIASKCMQDYR